MLAAPFLVRPPVSEAPAVWVPDPVGREIGHTPEPATRLRALSAWALDLWRDPLAAPFLPVPKQQPSLQNQNEGGIVHALNVARRARH